MPTWLIGDVQGCAVTLERLLERIAWDPARDRLWLVGDLVNRGLGSLEVLRWAFRQGDHVRAVLGNHDLHLLACAERVRKPKGQDTLGPVLAARDRADLLDWLADRPLCDVLRVGAERVLVVHAGVLPGWDVPRVEALAREVEADLRQGRRKVLEAIQEEGPAAWSDDLSRKDRQRVIVAALTRIRTVLQDGAMDPEYSGPPASAPAGRQAWFLAPGRRTAGVTVAFGHWAALGLVLAPRVLGLDSGCVWGRKLTAVRLEDRAVVQEDAARKDLPPR